MNASDVQNPNLLEQRTHNVELCMLKSMKLCDREDPDLGDGPFPLCLVGKTPGRLGDPITVYILISLWTGNIQTSHSFSIKHGVNIVMSLAYHLGAAPLTKRLVTFFSLLHLLLLVHWLDDPPENLMT